MLKRIICKCGRELNIGENVEYCPDCMEEYILGILDLKFCIDCQMHIVERSCPKCGKVI